MTKIKISLTPAQMLDMIRTHLAEANDVSEDEIEVTMNTPSVQIWCPVAVDSTGSIYSHEYCNRTIKSLSELPKNVNIKVI